MALLPEERENVLTYDEASDQYTIFCSSSKEATRMRRAGFEPYRVDEEGNGYYLVDRKQISFRAPSKGRTMTDEQRQAASERFKRMHQANKSKNSEV